MRTQADQVLKKTLDLKKLRLPKPNRVVDIRFKRDQEWTGEDAVWIWVILDDRTPEKERAYVKLMPIFDAIEKAVSASGLGLWPHVRVRMRSEQADIDAGRV
ncbi:MAG: hypothetical protein HYR85_03840 [Planctomycetes bacterium]|nr:hypothetical protein [Planctomycetota bacterium]MBI3848496.1 hypothetical protein [Planctomycetota bacterium]